MMIEVLLILIVSATHALPSYTMCYGSHRATVSSEDAATLCAPQHHLGTMRPESPRLIPNWQPNQFPDGVIRSNGRREQEIKLTTESRDGDGDLRAAESFNIGIYTWPNVKPWNLFGGHGHGHHGHHHHGGFWPPPWGAAPWGNPFPPWPPAPFPPPGWPWR